MIKRNIFFYLILFGATRKNLDSLKHKTELSLYKTLTMKNLNEEEKQLNNEANASATIKEKPRTVPITFNEANLDIIKQNELVRVHFEREARQAKALLNAKKIEEETENYKKKLLLKELMVIILIISLFK